jgi:hypothetical protein
MTLTQISITKSKTLGVMSDASGRTKFKKLSITATADLSETDIPQVAYVELSKFIENQLLYEQGLNK